MLNYDRQYSKLYTECCSKILRRSGHVYIHLCNEFLAAETTQFQEPFQFPYQDLIPKLRTEIPSQTHKS